MRLQCDFDKTNLLMMPAGPLKGVSISSSTGLSQSVTCLSKCVVSRVWENVIQVLEGPHAQSMVEGKSLYTSLCNIQECLG